MNTITYFKIKKISPQFSVANIERSIEFYTKKLGFKIDFRFEDFYAGIIKDDYSIHFKTSNPATWERETKKNNEGLNVLFLVEGIEDLCKDLSNKSIAFIQPLRSMPYGKEFHIEDPDGNIIAFLEEA
jgi:predicted enzyme related to lactoylglutathione lyase